MYTKRLLLILFCGVVFSSNIYVQGDDLLQEVLSMKKEIDGLKRDNELINDIQRENVVLKSDVDDLKALTNVLLETVREQSEKIAAMEEDKQRMADEVENLTDRLNAITDPYEPTVIEEEGKTGASKERVEIKDSSEPSMTMVNMSTNDRDTLSTKAANTKRIVTRQISQRVAFSVSLTPADLQNLGQGQIVIFDKVISSLGNDYDKRVGIFRVPVSGWYVFSLTLMASPDESQSLQVLVNGVGVFHCHASGDGYNTASRTVVSHANSGDDVWVQAATWYNGGGVHGYDHTTFTGFLLYAD